VERHGKRAEQVTWLEEGVGVEKHATSDKEPYDGLTNQNLSPIKSFVNEYHTWTGLKKITQTILVISGKRPPIPLRQPAR